MTQEAIDYLDADVAYYIGLVTARGTITDSGGIKRITIEFPFKNLKVQGIKTAIVQKNQILLSLDKAISRVNELTECTVRKEETTYAVHLILETLKNSIFVRDTKMLLKNKTSYHEFEVPDQIFEANTAIQKEFIRGFADVAGSARKANVNISGKHRVYLDVLNSPSNWKLPVQLCHLLQDYLAVPVDVIQWGHPNTRDPSLREYKAGRKDAWAREHQLKVFADDFEKIGFYMSHKQTVLEELAAYNRKKFRKAKFCSPPKRKRSKVRHPAENSEKLPQELKGKHYNSYWEICADLGCCRYAEFMKNQKRLSKYTKTTKKRRSKRVSN
jgi:hypothetical protein